MKNPLVLILIQHLFYFCLIAQVNKSGLHTQMNMDCKQCHICDTPTKANPCLILCPRNKIEIIRHSPEEGPENIIIDKVKNEQDMYKPSHFTHRLHSEMSLMAGGCSICHHFNPPGKIVSCSSCHEQKRNRSDLSKPDLKAAFHRQCMGCHKTWETNLECKNCHELNSAAKTRKQLSEVKYEHPKIVKPERIIYETKSNEGNFVTFYHNDHELFGNDCSDCHNQESCSTCHAELKLESIKADIHDQCSNCHNTEEECTKCHSNKVENRFDHFKTTGFSLSNYHNEIICRSCHKIPNKFSGLDKDCSSCHQNDEGYFNHKITGLELDENHYDAECVDCHQNNDFSNNPNCSECHDEEISFPRNLPGKRMK